EGLGTTARIALPVADGEAVAQPPAPSVQSLSGDETILLVEDDEVVRLLVGEALRGYGYTVLEASKGAEALELSRAHKGTIDLLLTDIVMPGMRTAGTPGSCACIRSAVSRRPRPAMETSVSTTSGRRVDASVTAASPSGTASTSNPSSSRMRPIERRTTSSSSTSRTRPPAT